MYILRYRSESSITSFGVFIIPRRVRPKSRPKAISIIQSTPLEVIVVYTVVLTSLYRPAPKKLDTITEQPMLHPKAKAINIKVISYPLPTAARAFSPMNLPATRLSAMLYNCWKIMLPNSGRQNLHSICDGFPTVKSLFMTLTSLNNPNLILTNNICLYYTLHYKILKIYN